jgi:uncharacterized protein (TIGR02145 family)
MVSDPDSRSWLHLLFVNHPTRTFIVLMSALSVWFLSCNRDDIRPDHFVGQSRSAAMDSLLRNAMTEDIAVEDFILPEGQNMKSFLLTINPALDSLLPRTSDHPFYGLTGNELKSLLITYMTMKAANAYASSPGMFPGNGPQEPAQDKLGYVEGSRQVDLRSPGEGSLSTCPRIFGLSEEGFTRHLLEGAYLTLPQQFDPFQVEGYNEALGLSGLAHELEFESFENFDQSFIRTGDIFVMFAANSEGGYSWHSGLVMASSDDPEHLLLADCFADLEGLDCKTSIEPNEGPRLISLSAMLTELNNANTVEYKIMRLKRKFYQPFVSSGDPDNGFLTVRYGEQLWMAEDLEIDGISHFSYDQLGLQSNATRGICPEGWHIPSLSEWETLFLSLNAAPYAWPMSVGQAVTYYQGAGLFMKSATGWDPPGNNLYNFNVLPKGYFDVDGETLKAADEMMGYWTSSSTNPEGAGSIIFERSHQDVLADPLDLKTLGYGCRCVKNVPGQSGEGCRYIPIVFHFLKCSQDPTHEVNNQDLSPIYDQVAYLNELFRFSDYCLEFYLACENGQPVFEVHDICNGQFTGINPSDYLSSDYNLNMASGDILASIVPQIQTATFDWNPDRYINVYIGVTGNGAIASVPATPSARDAIIMPIEWIAGENVAVSPQDEGRALSLGHEIGHYLGLDHPWGPVDHLALSNGPDLCNQINSGIADTPKFYGDVFQDTVFDCTTMQPIRNSNLMSYGDFSVATTLTPGQISRMDAVLRSGASVHGRLELVRASANCD